MKKRRISVRLAIAAAILLADLGAAGFAAVWLQDRLEEAERQERAVRGRLDSVRRDIRQMKAELAELPNVLAEYEALRQEGFLAEQQRLPLVRDLSALQAGYRIDPPRFTLAPQRILDERVPKGLTLVASRVELETEGLLDSDVLGFWLESVAAVPGAVRVVEFDLAREQDLDETLLGRIAETGPVMLTGGRLVLDWIALRPVDEEGKGKR